MARTNQDIVRYAQQGMFARTSTGAMSTEHTKYPSSGRLPRAFRHLLSEAISARRVSQVIYSYSTPIAWLDSEHGWIIPDVSYSITTSTKHQTHLYRLKGRRISLPYDATEEDAVRVLRGELMFTYNSTGVAVGTKPGPNYKAE